MEPLVYLAVGLYIVYHEFTRARRLFFDFQRLFWAFYLLYYVVPGFVIGFLRLVDYEYVNRYPVFGEENLSVPLVVFIFAISTMAGFSVDMRGRMKWAPVIVGSASGFKHGVVLACVILVGLLGVLIISIPFGGPIGWIKSAWVLRHTMNSQAIEEMTGGESGGLFLAVGRRLMPISLVAFNIALSAYLYSRGLVGKISLLTLLCVSSSVLLLVLAGQMSRGLVITTVLYPLILWSNFRGRLSATLVFGGIPLAILFLLFGKAFFSGVGSLLDSGGEVGIIQSVSSLDSQLSSVDEAFVEIVQNFSHRLASLIVALDYVGGSPQDARFAIDFFNVPVTWFSSMLEVEKPESITDVNTLLMLGSLYKYVPPGLVAFSFYSLWWFGPVLYGFALGLTINSVEEILVRNWDRHSWVPGWYSFFAMYFSFGILGFEPRTVANGLFNFLPVVIVFRYLLVSVKQTRDVAVLTDEEEMGNANLVDEHSLVS